MLREPAAVGSWLALGSAYFACAKPDSRNSPAATAVLAALFLGSAAATRYWLQETHSRWQILAFVGVAAAMSFGRRRGGERFAWADWLVWSAAAAAGVMLVRWRTEGSPI